MTFLTILSLSNQTLIGALIRVCSVSTFILDLCIQIRAGDPVKYPFLFNYYTDLTLLPAQIQFKILIHQPVSVTWPQMVIRGLEEMEAGAS